MKDRARDDSEKGEIFGWNSSQEEGKEKKEKMELCFTGLNHELIPYASSIDRSSMLCGRLSCSCLFRRLSISERSTDVKRKKGDWNTIIIMRLFRGKKENK